MIKGIRTVGKGRKEEVKGIIKKYLGVQVYIKTMRTVGKGYWWNVVR